MKWRKQNEGPQQLVYINYDFFISQYEVTRKLFREVMSYDPSQSTLCLLDCPVTHIHWNESASFCNKLSVKRGLPECYVCSGSKESTQCVLKNSFGDGKYHICPGYRIPTSAEWEYAARAGVKSSQYGKASEIMWYYYNSFGGIKPVGQKAPNEWGVFDMLGNVAEITFDRWLPNIQKRLNPVWDDQKSKDLRGCGSSNLESECRFARRLTVSSNVREIVGFRFVRTKRNEL